MPHDKRKRPWFPCANRPSASRRVKRAGPFAALLWPHLIGFIKEHGDRKGWIHNKALDPGDVAEWASLPDTDEWIGIVAGAIDAIKVPTVGERLPMLQALDGGWQIDPEVWAAYEHEDTKRVEKFRAKQRNEQQRAETNETECNVHPLHATNETDKSYILSRDNQDVVVVVPDLVSDLTRDAREPHVTTTRAPRVNTDTSESRIVAAIMGRVTCPGVDQYERINDGAIGMVAAHGQRVDVLAAVQSILDKAADSGKLAGWDKAASRSASAASVDGMMNYIAGGVRNLAAEGWRPGQQGGGQSRPEQPKTEAPKIKPFDPNNCAYKDHIKGWDVIGHTGTGVIKLNPDSRTNQIKIARGEVPPDVF